ncbi:MAG TPA: hypothetical protein VFI27_09835 [candidate division Zixibacteria bacterium]|nr:hypothetical protein [candidate division Zixibacteria bacterium]
MTNSKRPAQDKQSVLKPEREVQQGDQEQLPGIDLAAFGLSNIGSLADLPSHSSAKRLRQAVVLQLQQSHGNQYVQRALDNGSARDQIQRQEPQEEELSTEGLGLEEELEGHPFGLSGPDIQRDGEGESDAPAAAEPGTTANITLTDNTPNVTRPPQADIEADHGAGIAGWTTPTDAVTVPRRTATTLNITVTLSFEMELASEYRGDRLGVLRDHEDHHPTIAHNVAQTYLVDNLKTALEALPDFRNTGPVQSAIQTAHNDFVAHEGIEARAFDSTDYSRMEAAYYGVRTPLADLASATAAVQTMVTAIDGFNSGAAAAPEPDSSGEGAESPEEANSTRIIGLAQPVIDALSGLAQVDVDRLQYNPEFKGKVSTASGHVTTLSGTSLNEAAQTKLQELQTTLSGFTWTST